MIDVGTKGVEALGRMVELFKPAVELRPCVLDLLRATEIPVEYTDA